METSGSFLQPHLKGHLLQLRPLLPNDFEDLYRAASDPLIWELHPQSDRYKIEVFQKYFDGALKSNGAFAILESTTGKIMGSSRYYNEQPDQNLIYIGYTFLTREFWGGKYNLELKTLMLQHAFKKNKKVNFEIGIKNFRSRRAVEKIGARLISEKNLDGLPHCIYQMNNQNFTHASISVNS